MREASPGRRIAVFLNGFGLFRHRHFFGGFGAGGLGRGVGAGFGRGLLVSMPRSMGSGSLANSVSQYAKLQERFDVR